MERPKRSSDFELYEIGPGNTAYPAPFGRRSGVTMAFIMRSRASPPTSMFSKQSSSASPKYSRCDCCVRLPSTSTVPPNLDRCWASALAPLDLAMPPDPPLENTTFMMLPSGSGA